MSPLGVPPTSNLDELVYPTEPNRDFEGKSESAALSNPPRKRDSHIFERAAHDLYIEPSWCSARLFEVETFPGVVWDPCCGSGTIPESANADGLATYASDIADHGYGQRSSDFLTRAALPYSVYSVVTNPPYAVARKIVERALELGTVKVAIFFPIARVNAAWRWSNRGHSLACTCSRHGRVCRRARYSIAVRKPEAGVRISAGWCSTGGMRDHRPGAGCTAMMWGCRCYHRRLSGTRCGSAPSTTASSTRVPAPRRPKPMMDSTSPRLCAGNPTRRDRSMAAHKPDATPMLTIYASDRRCCGFILHRGQAGYEFFDAAERSRGLFATVADAANALATAVNNTNPGE